MDNERNCSEANESWSEHLQIFQLVIFIENDWFFFSFFTFIGFSVNNSFGKSNNLLDDCSWNLNRSKTLPQETVEEVDKDLRSDLTSVSNVLIKAFAHGIS